MSRGNSISYYNSIRPKVIIQISICKRAVCCSTLYFFLFRFFVASNKFKGAKKKILKEKFVVDFLNSLFAQGERNFTGSFPNYSCKLNSTSEERFIKVILTHLRGRYGI